MTTQELVHGPTGSGKTYYAENLTESRGWTKVYIDDEKINSFDLRSSITNSIAGEKVIIFDDFQNYSKSERKKVREAVEATNHHVLVLTRSTSNIGKRLKRKLDNKDVSKSKEDIINILEDEKEMLERDVKYSELEEIADEADGNLSLALAKLRNPNIEIHQSEDLGIFTKLGMIHSDTPVDKVVKEVEDINPIAFINWLEGTYAKKMRNAKKKEYYFTVLKENDKLLFETDSKYFYSSLIYGTRALKEQYRWNYPNSSENHQKDQILKKLREFHNWSEREARKNYPYFRSLIQNDEEFKRKMIKELELSPSDSEYLGIEHVEIDENDNEEGVVEEDSGPQAQGLMDF